MLSSTGLPFFDQLIVGFGDPEASQGMMATVLMGRVWLAGPMVMMGGGWSSMAVTSK